MPTLQVPTLNITLPLEELEAEGGLGALSQGEVVEQVREALRGWLSGRVEISPSASWDGQRWNGSLVYQGESYQWIIR